MPRPLTILEYLTSWKLPVHGRLLLLKDKSNVNCEIYYLTTLGPHVQGQKWKKTTKLSKILFFTSKTKRKTKCMVMMSMKPFTKIVKFMDPGVQTLGQGKYSHTVKMY